MSENRRTARDILVIELLAKLYNLHATRQTMAYSSLYHGQYVKQSTDLNAKLYEISGKNFIDYTHDEIKQAVAEAESLTHCGE